MSAGEFTVNEAFAPMDRVAAAADYVFDGRAGLAVATLDLDEGGRAQVVVTGERVLHDPHHAANTMGLSRYDDGTVVYEHHTARQLSAMGGVGGPHSNGCILNIQQDCLQFRSETAAGRLLMPAFAGGVELGQPKELPQPAHFGVARMVERFALGEHTPYCHSNDEASAAIVAMGGARYFYRDRALRKYVGTFATDR